MTEQQTMNVSPDSAALRAFLRTVWQDGEQFRFRLALRDDAELLAWVWPDGAPLQTWRSPGDGPQA